MSWGLGWKRPSEIFHLRLNYGNEEPEENPDCTYSSSSSVASIVAQDQEIGFRIELEWSAGDDEDQVALRLQSQLMVALPMPQDTVEVELRPKDVGAKAEENVVVEMRVVKRREPLRAVTMTKPVGSGQQSDGTGVLTRLLKSNLALPMPGVTDGVSDCGEHWKSVTVLSLCGCGLSVSPGFLIFILHLFFSRFLHR